MVEGSASNEGNQVAVDIGSVCVGRFSELDAHVDADIIFVFVFNIIDAS